MNYKLKYDIMQFSKTIRDNYQQYDLFINEDKTPSCDYLAIDEEKKSRTDTKKKDMKIYCDGFSDVAFTVEQKKDIDSDFKFSLKCTSFCEKPLFRYDSSGPSHRNSNFQIPINEQKVPTPHFHKYWNDGKEIAYKTKALEDEVQRKALEDISICIYHFMDEANIKYEKFELNSSPGLLPFPREKEILDPLENVSFEE